MHKLIDQVTAFMERNPEVEAVRWTQGLNRDRDFVISQLEVNTSGCWRLQRNFDDYSSIWQEMEELEDELGEHDTALEEEFGSDQRVVVTKNRIFSEEWP